MEAEQSLVLDYVDRQLTFYSTANGISKLQKLAEDVRNNYALQGYLKKCEEEMKIPLPKNMSIILNSKFSFMFGSSNKLKTAICIALLDYYKSNPDELLDMTPGDEKKLLGLLNELT